MSLVLEIDERIRIKKNSKTILFNRKTGTRFIASNSTYKTFEEVWTLKLKSQAGGVKFPGRVYVDYVFYVAGHHRVDGDNMEGGVNDILQKAGILVDDSYIIEHHTKKLLGSGRWGATITISDLEDGGE